MLQQFRSIKVFVALTLLTALAASLSLYKRHQVEIANKNVLIAVEADAVRSLSAAQGMTLEEGLKSLKARGLNGLVLSEETIGELITDGRASISGVTVQGSTELKTMTFPDTVTSERVLKGLKIRFGKLVQSTTLRNGMLALPPIDTETLRATSVNLNPMLAQQAQKMGFTIVGRFANPVGVSSGAVTETINWAKENGTSVFLALGEQVLGRRDSMEATKVGLENNKIFYSSPEFAKLGGDTELLGMLPEKVIRLHAAQAAELDKLSLEGALERYTKAAKERNMRILLLRPLTSASPMPLDSFGEFIAQTSESLVHEGLMLGNPEPFTDPGVSKWIKLAVALFAGVSAVWVSIRLFGDKTGAAVGGLLALVILAGSQTSGKGLDLSTLLMSMVFPIGSYYVGKRLRIHAVLTACAMFAISMVGGMCVAALLNSVPYYIRAEAFFGVKASVFLPILVIGVVAFADFNDLKSALKDPITWGSAGIALVIVGALALMMMRTGNDNPNAVSGGELAFRGFMEQLLPVRPRQKEFLLGFPALLIGLLAFAKAGYSRQRLGRNSGWVSLCFMLGAIGLTDAVNTLCHLHTPIVVSLLRNVIGLVLGLAIGGGIWMVIQKRVTVLPAGENG